MSQSKAQLLDPQGDFTLTGQLIGVGATFSGNVSIGGTLTKQDVTNVDSVGIITARSGVNVTGGNVFIGQGGSGANNAELKLQAGAGTGNDIIAFLNQAGATKGNITYDTDNNFLLFNIDGAERARIGSSGLAQFKVDAASSAATQVRLENNATAGNGANPDVAVLGYSSAGTQKASIRAAVYGEGWMSFHNNNDSEKMRLLADSRLGIGTDNPTFSDISSVSSSSKKHGIELFKDGTDTASAIKLKADNGSGTASWSQLGYSGANATSHWANYNTAGTKTGEIVIDSTGSVEVVSGNLYVNNGTNLQVFLNAGDGSIELTRASGGAFIDFKNSTGEDHDARLQEASGGLTCSTGALSDSKGNLRSIPRNNQGSAYTLVAADAGKCITAGGNITVDNSVFVAGDVVSIIADTGSTISIVQGSGVTMYNTGDASTGSKTLASRGMCTIWFVAANNCYLSGSGIS